MNAPLIRYVEPVFRPPSEAESLILPVTDGCSWNACTFCEMYTAPQKAFRARSEDEVLTSIRQVGERYGDRVRRVFLADGDALVLPTRRLLAILEAIKTHLPAVHRVSSYCLARNLKKKTVAELVSLREAGLSMAYLGAESGDDLVLEKVKKGETHDSTRAALDKLGDAGITRSARRPLRPPRQRHPAGVPVHPGGELPSGRSALSRRLSRMGAPGPGRPVPRDGALPIATGAAPHRVPVGSRQQLPDTEGHPGGGQGEAAGTGETGY